MRQFPREIEADLLFRGIDVADWHQGRMSSRRLLLLIDALPDDSAYRKERRDHDWSEHEWMLATLANETKLLRAEQAAIHAQYSMKVHLFESPLERMASEALAERVKDLRSHVVGTIRKAQQMAAKTE